MKQVLAFLIAYLFFTTGAFAQAPIEFKTSLLVDPTGGLTIAEVTTKPFLSVPHAISRGYTTSVTWLKIDLPPSALPELILSVRPTYLDDVRLFSPLAAGDWSEQRLGDHVAFSDKVRTELDNSFVITPKSMLASTHYLRVQTTSTTLISLSVLTNAESRAKSAMTYLFIGLYAGFMGFLAFSALIRYAMMRDSLWLASALLQITVIFGLLMLSGFAAKHVWPTAPLISDALLGYGSVAQVGAGTLFTYLLLKSFKPHWSVLFPCQLVIYAAIPALVILLALGHMQQAMKMNAVIILLMPLWFLGAVWFVKPEDQVLRYLLRGTQLISTAYLAYYITPLLGIGLLTEQHAQGAWIASAVTSLLGFWVLLRRQQLQIQAGIAASKAATLAQQQVTFEQTKLAEASSFMAMLLHELKTPLSVIRLAALSLSKLLATAHTDPTGATAKRLASIQKSLDSIDTVLLSVADTDLLEQGSVKIHKTQHDLVPWLQEQMMEHFQSQRARLRVELPQQLIASVDSSLLSLMLHNLLRNALAYSPAASMVTLRLKPELAQTQFCIEIENEVGGAGRPDPQLVFQKYYRSDKAHQATGTGLGLYWVHGMAKLWSGDLRYCPFVDELNHGAPIIFQLRLPC